jgi:hypothetical protein
MVYGAIFGAAAAKAEEKHCLEKLEAANATSLESSVEPEDAGISGDFSERTLERLIKQGEVRRTEDGRVYVDQKHQKQY